MNTSGLKGGFNLETLLEIHNFSSIPNKKFLYFIKRVKFHVVDTKLREHQQASFKTSKEQYYFTLRVKNVNTTDDLFKFLAETKYVTLLARSSK